MWSSSWQRPSARVGTTARTANAEFRHGLCAYVVTGYENEDYVEVVLQETDVHSIDVVLDTISTDTVTLSTCAGAARPAGLDRRYRKATERHPGLG